MKTGAQDCGYEHDMDAESKFAISGTTTPSGASYVPQVLEPEDELSVTYSWGERGATSQDMPSHEAEDYIAHATNRSSNAQPHQKWDESNYWTDAPEGARADLMSTSLPNPKELRVDGEIEVNVTYDDGLMGLSIEFDTEYVHEDADEEISEGSVRVSYAEPFEEEAESEFERTRSALDKLDRLEGMLE